MGPLDTLDNSAVLRHIWTLAFFEDAFKKIWSNFPKDMSSSILCKHVIMLLTSVSMALYLTNNENINVENISTVQL